MSPKSYLDLRNTPCPLNLIRIRLALESVGPNSEIQVDIDEGDPEDMVIPSLKEAGHKVDILSRESSFLSILVICGDREV